MSDASPEPLLNASQRRLVGFTLSFLALLATVALFVVMFGVMGRLLAFFSNVLWPLAVAGILALILRPIVEIFEHRLRLGRGSAVSLLYGLVLLVLAGVFFLITPPLVEQILDFIAFIPEFWQNAIAYAQRHYPEWIELAHRQMANPTVKKMVESLLVEMQTLVSQMLPTLKSAGLGALSLFAFVTHVAIIPIYLFFFLLSSKEPTRKLPQHLSFLSESVRGDVVFLVREFIEIVVSFFRGQLLIGLIMGALLSVGFTVVGLKFGLFIGLALGVLNIVPYLGTIIGLSIALPLAFLQPEGGWPLVGWVLAVFCLVQVIESWILTPKIMGARTGLHPVIIIVAIFFWGTALDGIFGMVLAIPLTAFFVTAWRLLKRKYFSGHA